MAFCAQIATKRQRKHTNVYHAMSNDRGTKKHQLKLNKLLWVLVKYFDGWAAVILPVDVTVEQNGVLRTNSNKTPEKTHKCLSRNDRGTKKH